MNKYNYNPLPEYLTIKKSKIHGKGLFIKGGYSARLLDLIGITHHIVNGNIIRTPLGGWLNDGGENANCTLIPSDDNGNRVPFGKQTTYVLQISKYQVGGEELTLNYNQWDWILDGSLYPKWWKIENSENDFSDYLINKKGGINPVKDNFYSPYKNSVDMGVVDVRGVNMGQHDLFSTKIVDEYIGAPGGLEKSVADKLASAGIAEYTGFTLQRDSLDSLELTIENSSFDFKKLLDAIVDRTFMCPQIIVNLKTLDDFKIVKEKFCNYFNINNENEFIKNPYNYISYSDGLRTYKFKLNK